MMFIVALGAYLIILGAPILLLVYLYFRQAGTGRNRVKLDELNSLYGSGYRFSFRWPQVRAKILSGVRIDEDEALRIATTYLVENGRFRKDAFRLTMEFSDSADKYLFTVCGTPDEKLAVVRIKDSFFRTEWDVSKRISISQGGA